MEIETLDYQSLKIFVSNIKFSQSQHIQAWTKRTSKRAFGWAVFVENAARANPESAQAAITEYLLNHADVESEYKQTQLFTKVGVKRARVEVEVDIESRSLKFMDFDLSVKSLQNARHLLLRAMLHSKYLPDRLIGWVKSKYDVSGLNEEFNKDLNEMQDAAKTVNGYIEQAQRETQNQEQAHDGNIVRLRKKIAARIVKCQLESQNDCEAWKSNVLNSYMYTHIDDPTSGIDEATVIDTTPDKEKSEHIPKFMNPEVASSITNGMRSETKAEESLRRWIVKLLLEYSSDTWRLPTWILCQLAKFEFPIALGYLSHLLVCAKAHHDATGINTHSTSHNAWNDNLSVIQQLLYTAPWIRLLGREIIKDSLEPFALAIKAKLFTQ